MGDNVTVNGGKSVPEVALELLKAIAAAEDKYRSGTFYNCDRTYILDTFSEAYRAARGSR